MGGTTGMGNYGRVTEFNFMLDPEATRIVFESGVHLTMIPLDVCPYQSTLLSHTFVHLGHTYSSCHRRYLSASVWRFTVGVPHIRPTDS